MVWLQLSTSNLEKETRNTSETNNILAMKCMESSLKYPSIRFLNGGHYGQGGLYTYSHVVELYVISNAQRAAQERVLKGLEVDDFSPAQSSPTRTYTLEVSIYKLQVICFNLI